MLPVAIFRFSPTEGPGHFAEWSDSRGLACELIAVDQGEDVPHDARAFSGIVMMGGPMSANDELPWSAPLSDLLRGAVAAEVPVLGHCLGAQILAKALGAPVSRAAVPEIGWGEVQVVGDDAWFGQRTAFTAFQWHYDAFALPQGAMRLLTNAHNPNQAFALGKHIGLQCHIEMTRSMVEVWCRAGAAELPARSSASKQSRDDIYSDLEGRLAALSQVADEVYVQWAKGLAR